MADDADTADRRLSTLTEADDAALVEEYPADDDDDRDDDDDSPDASLEGDVLDGHEARTAPADGVRLAVLIGVVTIAALAALTVWLGVQAAKADASAQQHSLFLTVGRQGALNLTTIKAAEVDTDVQRILDSSTGMFHDDFQKRSVSFVALVKQTQASSEGTVTEAGVESATDDAAQILVAVAVKTTTSGAAEQQPRLWRMRLTVEKAEGSAKISDVTFVP